LSLCRQSDWAELAPEQRGKYPSKRLNLHKEWITQETGTFEMVVDEKPTFAGIDPYNKLIDRNPSDNLIEVEKK